MTGKWYIEIHTHRDWEGRCRQSTHKERKGKPQLSISASSLLWTFIALSAPSARYGPPFLYKFTHSSFLCLYGWSQWVLYFANEGFQGWSVSQTRLWWSATFSMWHLFNRAEPMLLGLDAGSGTTSIVRASHPLIYLSPMPQHTRAFALLSIFASDQK